MLTKQYNMSINLCRICLDNTAHLPIFDFKESDPNIQDKLLLCLKEKIEDQEGYPRYICEECNNILDTLYDFINKYKKSSIILENGLGIVKEENYNLSGNSQSDEELPTGYIKKESDLIICEGDLIKNECMKLVQKTITIKKEPLKRVSKKKPHSENKSLDVSNNIANSILEGEFVWNGSEWCLSSKERKKKVTKLLQPAPNSGKKIIKIPTPKENTPNPPKLCDLCGEVFKSHERLTVHKNRTHHNKLSQCKHCYKLFGSIYDLNRHVKRKHEKERNFVCAICGKGFAFKGELSNHHKNVHEKHLKPEKQFKCKFCSKSYKCSKSVVVHERSAHTGYRPAACTVCGTRFFHEEYLKEHMRLHTGETPFKCPICGRGYAQRGNMKSHLRIHRRSELDDETLSKMRPNYLKLLKA